MGVCEAGLDRPQQARAIFQQLMRTTPADDSDRKKASKYLTELSLVGTKISDTGLEHLKAMESLQSVFLAGTQVTDEGVKALQEARPMLEIVR